MEVAVTRMSRNGQVVIPAEIRKDAGISPAMRFLVFNEGDLIYLKPLRKEALMKRLRLADRIRKSERQIAAGKGLKVDARLSPEEIDELLMG